MNILRPFTKAHLPTTDELDRDVHVDTGAGDEGIDDPDVSLAADQPNVDERGLVTE
jgi:hypothetical protein